MRISIASRKSDLARLQAKTVGLEIQRHFPDVELEFHFSASFGDQHLDMNLRSTEGRGVFTADLQQKLINGEIDMVVHSWKDLPIEDGDKTFVAATLQRHDMRDLLLVKRSAWARVIRKGQLRILTSSPRREYHLQNHLLELLPAYIEDLQFVPVRGNIPRRIEKLMDGDEDGLVIAKAAVDRMLSPEASEFFPVRNRLREWLQQCYWMVLPLNLVPCAPAQGALAIEISREAPESLKQMMDQINDFESYESVERERKTLSTYGGGCHQKIGVSCLKRTFGYMHIVRGESESGEALDQQEIMNRYFSLGAVSPEDLWPLNPKESQFFQREPVEEVPPETPVGDLWVSRETALPELWRVPFDQVVWTSGLTTWKKLAQRGVWVNGSSESLGEVESPRIETLLGRSPKWLKLSHTRGVKPEGWGFLPTYKLVSRQQVPDLSNKKYFFWMSASQFFEALRHFPEIREKSHACGPGHTFQILKEELGNHGQLEVYLSYEHWKKTMRCD